MLVRDLGLKDYDEVWTLQRKLVFERGENAVPDILLLCQHRDVYTIGRSSKQTVAKGLPTPVRVVERGGDLTWHGPGQLVGYPILDLRALGLKPRSYLSALEAVLAEAIAPFGIRVKKIAGFTGLWVGKKKIASIAVAVRGSISYHGFALNMNNSLAPFKLIEPCRLESDVMTTMALVSGAAVDEASVSKAVGSAFINYFGRMTTTPFSSPKKRPPH
ncbi:MAG: lipoyl(octanoyl) transferase LipB [Elusimicrobiota bacterium]